MSGDGAFIFGNLVGRLEALRVTCARPVKGTLALIPFRFICHAVASAAALLVSGAGAQVHAQGQLQAWYTASLSGLPVGTGSWFVGIPGDRYAINVHGSTGGVARLFSNGKGFGAAWGSIVGGRLVASNYAMTITNDNNPDQINVAFAADAVKQITPPETLSPDRVPLIDAHYQGVTDPLTGSLVRVEGTGTPVRPEACQGATAIFNGHMRFEVRLAFKRMEGVRANKGYEGPAVVCALYFTPVAGHNAGRAALKYLAQLKDMEVSLAPIANTRFLAPFRVSIPTPFGLGVLQATEFTSVATGPPQH